MVIVAWNWMRVYCGNCSMELNEGVLSVHLHSVPCTNYHSTPSFSSMLQLPQYTFIQFHATITTVHLHSVPCNNYHSIPSFSSMLQLPQYTFNQFHATNTRVYLHSVPCYNYHSTPSFSSMLQLPQYTLGHVVIVAWHWMKVYYGNCSMELSEGVLW
jgi:hypothetical protein